MASSRPGAEGGYQSGCRELQVISDDKPESLLTYCHCGQGVGGIKELLWVKPS